MIKCVCVLFCFFVREMVHHFGWSKVYPSALGADDFSSIACKEMARLTCTNPGWFHPENTCPNGIQAPGNPASVPLQGKNIFLKEVARYDLFCESQFLKFPSSLNTGQTA